MTVTFIHCINLLKVRMAMHYIIRSEAILKTEAQLNQ